MDVEIRPRIGAGPFRLGMPVGDARAAVAKWGLFRTLSSDEEPGQIVLRQDRFAMDVVLGFTRGALSGVELVRFQHEDADVRVLLDGLDVFRIPSGDLFEQLAERGHIIEENDLGFDALPELKVILANRSSHAYPVDEEGDPLYYDYVLVADRI
ncbi:hypothetical protein [Streptomyces sp. NPDC001851]|uniref:hypothetical protein n=1 Tax=Streptomyces sp. NPDC001851 TaxID=3154529 RepID=UPI0033205CB0